MNEKESTTKRRFVDQITTHVNYRWTKLGFEIQIRHSIVSSFLCIPYNPSITSLVITYISWKLLRVKVVLMKHKPKPFQYYLSSLVMNLHVYAILWLIIPNLYMQYFLYTLIYKKLHLSSYSGTQNFASNFSPSYLLEFEFHFIVYCIYIYRER